MPIGRDAEVERALRRAALLGLKSGDGPERRFAVADLARLLDGLIACAEIAARSDRAGAPRPEAVLARRVQP